MTRLLELLKDFNLLDFLRAAVDVAFVAYILYRLILLAKGRRAWQILIGIGVFFALVLGSEVMGLVTTNWLLRQITPLGPVAIVILLYPELREILEKLGRLDFWGAPLSSTSREDNTATLEEVVRATMLLAARKTGALMVLERETGLDDIIATGTVVDSEVSSELLATLFYVGTPLHDGAVIIRGSRIAAAGCTLPLSDSPNISANVHMRHRAAIGVSEASDAVVVVVSEETGTVSIAVNGKLNRGLNDDKLRQKLYEAFGKSIGKKPRNGSVSLNFSRRRSNGKSNGKGAGPITPATPPAPGPGATRPDEKPQP
ncbi:MAG TPA: diadenylate cyclase CdaA [Armatimonadaceae bacterium]|nr:diadenylate cyclase CdaA [Armatimonadaceae bacterium]